MSRLRLFYQFLKENPAVILLLVLPPSGLLVGWGLAKFIWWFIIVKGFSGWFLYVPLFTIAILVLVILQFLIWERAREEKIIDKLSGK